jgi:hypothetical protein
MRLGTRIDCGEEAEVREIKNPDAAGWAQRLGRIAPGLPALLSYKRADFPHDLVAGLSVAAVALPVGVAYAQLAGFNPAVGLYASILPLVAYALFGTSRQLIVGPDAATCAIVAAAVAPLAAGNPDLYLSLSLTLALLAGLFCITASFLKLGALADFLSKPILVGFLNGIAISIVLGQLGKIFGFPIESEGILPRLLEFASKLGLTHWPTLVVGLVTFLVLLISPRLLPRLPAALVAMAVAVVVVKLFGLDALGVKTVGDVPRGLPALRFPNVPSGLLPQLLAEAAGLALVSFSSMMLTGRSFASKNRYEIDTDREFAVLGAANIAAALSQGFAVSGADSRTAMNDAAGGRTQVAGLVAAASIAEGVRALPAGHPGRGGGGRRARHPVHRDPGLAALRAPGLAAQGRDPGGSRGLPRPALHRAARGRPHHSRAAALPLQRPRGLLQCSPLQARGAGRRRGGRTGVEVAGDRQHPHHHGGRDRAVHDGRSG